MAGLWAFASKITTVTVTFVQATFVQATFVQATFVLAAFVHIRKISAGTEPILTKLYR